MSNLREYQSKAIQSLRGEFGKGLKRVLLYSPTGSGKSVIAESIIRDALRKGTRVAFIVNRIGLVKQFSERMSDIRHGIIQGLNTSNVDCQLILCSVQTVARRGLPEIGLIVIDEAHGVAGSKEYKTVLANYNNVPTIGLSATPFSRGLGAFDENIRGEVFESMVIASTIKELIKQEHLVDCDIYAPSEPDLKGVKLVKNEFGEKDYSLKELGVAVDKPELIGDIVQHWFKLANNKPTVVFATNIAHSVHIAEEFKKAGVAAEHIDCYVEQPDRDAMMQRVLSGQTKVVCNVAILTEGWDFPACEVMILARPTKSLTRWVQMAGRILRPFEGKTKGIILDHSGSTIDLGYPTDDLPLELDDGKPKLNESKQKKEEAKPKKCPKCSFVKPPKVRICPVCNHEPVRVNEIEHGDGELKKLERASNQEKQAFYSELLYIQQEKGYRDGWIGNNYKDKFKVFPRGMLDIPKTPTFATRNWLTHKAIAYAKGKAKGQERLKEFKNKLEMA